MFERLKQRAMQQTKAEITQHVRESANEGRIRTGSVVVEGLLFLALIAFGGKNGGCNSQPNEIHIHIHKDMWEE